MSKTLTVKIKKYCKRNLVKDIKTLKKKKKTSNNLIVNLEEKKISHNKKLVEYRKKYNRMKKTLYIIIRKYFNLENFASL